MATAIHNDKSRSEQTRKRIISASIRAFSEYGLAGARTEAIAKAAKVNKALLYYYFKSKDDLYTAALEAVAKKVMENTLGALQHDCSEGERLLRIALNHFDRIFTQHEFQNLMQQEMIRFRKGEGDAIPIFVRTMFQPLMREMEKIVREGMRKGELCEADWLQVIYAALGANVFYFLSAPLMRLVIPFEPFAQDVLEFRRKAALHFLGSALFVNRKHGAKLAKRVLKEMPMPTIKKLPAWRAA
jgi:TetR/AcrR family transcriptional regulator